MRITPLGHRLAWIAAVALGLSLASSGSLSAPVRAPAQLAQPLSLPVVPASVDCSSLKSINIGDAVGAKTVIAAAAVDDRGGDFSCSVKVVIDEYARFELRLPVKTWEQRLLFGGGPGAQIASGVDLTRFATVSWDDLGRRQDEDVLANDYHGQVMAGYRGMHLQVLAAKELIKRFYGRGPRFSYWNACSNPGREGMIEAQRFPEDFDGIGAGCPPINTTMNNGIFHAWGVLTNTGVDGKAILTIDKLPILHKAVLDQCDAADGAVDGIVSLPFACHPVFTKIECRPGQDPAGDCVTAAQIHVAEELYRGAHDAQGRRLTPGGVLPGSELAWTATIVPGGRFGGPEEDRTATTKAIRSHYSLPALPKTWQLSDLKFTQASFDATTQLSYLHDGTNPDLSGYAKAGHKLMLYMALGDTNVLPEQVILYWMSLQQQMGAPAVAKFARFYVLPGVYHCGGGDGPVIANLLVPLMAWVERGVAPGAVAGVHVPRGPGGPPQGDRPGGNADVPDLTRPIYPYPYIARYTGTGSVRDAANFVEGAAHPAPAWIADWAGIKFYKPGYMKWCDATNTRLVCRNTR